MSEDDEAEAVLAALGGIWTCKTGCGTRVTQLGGLCINCWLQQWLNDDWYSDDYFKRVLDRSED